MNDWSGEVVKTQYHSDRMERTQSVPQCQFVDVLYREGPRIAIYPTENGVDDESCNSPPSGHGYYIQIFHLSTVHETDDPEHVAQEDQEKGRIVFT